jgi:membrane-associated phospholipid phosphatase
MTSELPSDRVEPTEITSATPEDTAAIPGATAVLVTAAVLLALVAKKVSAKETEPVDKDIREVLQENRTPALDVAAKPITVMSIPLVIVAATASLVWWLHESDRNDAALAIGLTPILAAAAGQSFTMFFPQQSPPDATSAPTGKAPEATFPSGHTTGVTAEALAIAYILSREKLASPTTLAALLAWPLVVGVTRLYRDRHWFSDVLAGWIAGIGVASLSVIFYQARVRRRSSP